MINSVTETQTYRFENIEVDCARGCLVREDKERHLRQKTFQVLVYLLDRRERLVSKEELMETVWKNTAVTDDALVQSIKEIRRALGDNSHNPRFIKTVPKAGYRFIAPVEEFHNGGAAFALETEEITRVEIEYEEIEEGEKESKAEEEISVSEMKLISTLPPPSVSTSLLRFSAASPVRLVAAILILIPLAAVAFYFIAPRSETSDAAVVLPQKPGKRTIAVMYFKNQSKDAELEWLREGLADMLISNLSRSEKLTVLDRQRLYLLLERSGHEAGEEITLETALTIARKSRTEALVVGSFARLGEKIRLDAQLYDAASGELLTTENLTAEKPERILTEIDLLSFKLANRLSAGEPEETRANLARAMTDNLEAYRYYSLALEKARGMHKTEAFELFEKSVALDPEFAMAHARIGYTYAVTWGLAEKAKPHLERAFALSDRLTEKDRLYITAWYAIANLDYPAAITHFREIVQKFPLETEAYHRLGNLLRGEERFEEALDALRQGLTIDPESAALYNSLGLQYSMLGRHDEAIAMHERYVALAPGAPNARDSLGMSYQWAGRYDEAIAEYTRALELNPNFEVALVHLGNAHFQTGRYRTAIELYERYIAIAASDLERARGYSNIAHIYRKQKNPAQAARTAKQAFEKSELYVWEMTAAALDSGDRAAAKKFEERLFAKAWTSTRGSRTTRRFENYQRGYIALKNGQTDEALENFQTALRHSAPGWDIDALEDCLANAYLELGRFDEAIAEYERVLRLNPNYPLARFHLAQVFERKGQTAQARENYRLFLDAWKNADADIPEIIAARNFLG